MNIEKIKRNKTKIYRSCWGRGLYIYYDEELETFIGENGLNYGTEQDVLLFKDWEKIF
jgi:hypothetical protein